MEDNAEIMHKYVEALEEERRKIQVFHRELPLCVELVTKAIDAYRQQLTTTIEYLPGRSECSEQTSSDSQAIVEFIPIKRSFSSEEEESHKPKSTERNDKVGKKTDWLRSAQLWNQDPDPSPKQDQTRNTSSGTETKKSGGAFHPSQRETGVTATSAVRTPLSTQTAATSSTSADTVNGGSGRREEKEGQSHRKARRCWSPELHRRFLNALQQLGGTHAATPKQIRELMKVDGLTNDEVKSHLQKYRLHTRRPSQPIHNNSNPQPPQFVVMGGVWVPAPEYATGPATTGETNGVAANGVYAPVAVPPQASMLCSQQQQQQQQQQQEQKQLQQSPLHSEEKGSRSVEDDNTRSNSPATSSSTHTTTASHAF